MEDTRLAFERATEGMAGSEQALGAMADAYARLISARPETLLIQMRGYAVVAAAEAEGDDQAGELVQAGWMTLRKPKPCTCRWAPMSTRPRASLLAACSATLLRPSGFPPFSGARNGVV